MAYRTGGADSGQRLSLLVSPRSPSLRFSSHRVARGGHPPPAPTERSVRISRTTLFRNGFTTQQETGTPDTEAPAWAAATESAS